MRFEILFGMNAVEYRQMAYMFNERIDIK